MANLYLDLRSDPGCGHKPVHLARDDALAEQFIAGTDHHGARRRQDLDDIHGLAKSSWYSPPLPHGEACVAGVLAHDRAVAAHERAVRE